MLISALHKLGSDLVGVGQTLLGSAARSLEARPSPVSPLCLSSFGIFELHAPGPASPGQATTPGPAVVRMRPSFGARCDLACAFCFEKGRHLLPPVPLPGRRALIRRSLDLLIEHIPQQEVTLRGEDILRYPHLPELLDLFEAHGKRVALRTPGHLLSEPSLCARFAGRGVVFELTFFSCDPRVTHRMSGSNEAHRQLCRAIGNLAAQGIRSRVSVVVTRDNVAGLADTIRFLADELGVLEVTLPVFRTPAPQSKLTQPPPAGMCQHPPFDLLGKQLGQLAARLPPGSGEKLCLLGCPPCQISEEIASAIAASGGLSLSLAPPAIAASRSLHRACADCPLRGGCGFMDGRYPRHLPLLHPNPDAAVSVARILASGQARHDSLHNLLRDLRELARGGDLIAVQQGAGAGVLLRSYHDGLLFPGPSDSLLGEAVTLEAFLERATTALLIRPGPQRPGERLAVHPLSQGANPDHLRNTPLEAARWPGTVLLCTHIPRWDTGSWLQEPRREPYSGS